MPQGEVDAAAQRGGQAGPQQVGVAAARRRERVGQAEGRDGERGEGAQVVLGEGLQVEECLGGGGGGWEAQKGGEGQG